MDGKTHVPTGYAVATGVTLATAAAAGASPDPWVVLAAGLVAAGTSAGSLSPDCDQTPLFDHARDALRAAHLPTTWLNHREVTHWAGWPILLAWWTSRHVSSDVRFTWWAICLGWGTHILGDFIFGAKRGNKEGTAGVPVTPFGIGPHVGLGFKSGGRAEAITRPFILAAAAYTTWAAVDPGNAYAIPSQIWHPIRTYLTTKGIPT